MATFMTRLKTLRKERGITQDAVSTVLDIGKSTYQNYEQGLSGAPLHRLLQLSAYFDVSLDFLCGYSDERTRAGKQVSEPIPLAQQLRTLRKERKWSQIAVAQKVGIMIRTYVKYEHAEIVPPLDKLFRLADVFEVTLDELAGCTVPKR